MNINEFDVLGLKNPLPYDYKLKWDKAYYVIKSGGTKMLPEFLARHGATKIARLYITEKFGFARINDQKLMQETMDSLLTGVLLEGEKETRTESQVLQEQVEKINENSTLKDAEIIEDGFSGLNVIKETEEELRKQEMERNNPAGARAEELAKLSFNEIKELCKSKEITVFQKGKADLINEIVEKELKQ